jgi:hypothetical protein
MEKAVINITYRKGTMSAINCTHYWVHHVFANADVHYLGLMTRLLRRVSHLWFILAARLTCSLLCTSAVSTIPPFVTCCFRNSHIWKSVGRHIVGMIKHSFRCPSLFYLLVHSRCRGCLFSLDPTQIHTTVGRTPLDEGSVRRRDLYLTTHKHFTRDKHPCPRCDSNPRSQQVLGRRPT